MTKEEFLEITKHLQECIKGSEFDGKTYAVGGSVRDYVMDNEIKDIDLVVELPDGGLKLAKWLEENNRTKGSVVLYPTYGTAMFHLAKYPDYEIECVQTRGEQYHKETRNPETCYAPITEDCFRRDLTINALYYDLSKCEIVDFTKKGLYDIKKHIIRVTNDNPDVVFDDDPLRILRVVRFANRFGWQIEKNTLASMKEKADRLSIITQERITDEFTKILVNKNKYGEDGIELLDEVIGLDRIIPEFGTLWTLCKKRLTYNNILVGLRHSDADLCTRLAVLLYMFSLPVVENILQNMKYSNDVVNEVLFLLNDTLFDGISYVYEFRKIHKMRALGYEVSKLQHACKSKEMFFKYLDVRTHIAIAQNEDWGFRQMVVDYIDQNGTDMYNYKLPVDGNDVMRVMEIGPSKTVGNVLDSCLHRAFEKNNLTREECIAQFELLRDYNKKKNNK